MVKIVLALLFFCVITMVNGKFDGHYEDDQWLNKLTKAHEKVTKLRFYIQDEATGPNATIVTVAQAPKSKMTPSGFGTINVLDDILTEGPEPTSKQIGRAQGTTTFIGQDKIAFLMSINFVFTRGKYRGSTLMMLGRNVPYLPIREIPIVGGTGVFQFARGLVRTKTYKYNPNTTNGVYEYNIVTIHY